ncbi:GNAT family N-acetyltransferase [Pelagibius sp.]|uniref:GNAT family N-acetyltransferase n=1 Tax=Pelagibius sp. TaxID=1931238 RepID=UPI00260E7367|nr:GNAT family N-acetyltransferase [Pelagibius sp.]
MELVYPAFEPGIGNRIVRVRDARTADMPAIQIIYAREVTQGLASFEEAPPAVGELLARHARILEQGLPYLAAELDGQLVGYGYASAYRPRAAYRYTVEDSVYVAAGAQGRGVGRALLSALVARCEAGPWRQMIAVIGDSANRGSVALHERLGFRRVGTLTSVGFKFGRPVDTVLMQRALDGGSDGAAQGNGPAAAPG